MNKDDKVDTDLIEELKEESAPKLSFPTTVRLPRELEREMRYFCKDNNVKMSVLLRRIISQGWKRISE